MKKQKYSNDYDLFIKLKVGEEIDEFRGLKVIKTQWVKHEGGEDIDLGSIKVPKNAEIMEMVWERKIDKTDPFGLKRMFGGLI